MLDDKILVKTSEGYFINEEWANKMQKQAEQIAEKVKSKIKEVQLEEMKDGESLNLTFKGIREVGWFLIDKLMKAPNPEKKQGLALWRFCYSIVGLEEKHYKGLREAFAQNDWKVRVRENNETDKMFGETLKQYGAKEIKFGVDCATKLSDTMILGDYIAEITYPTVFRKTWEIQNRLPKKVAEFNLAAHILNMRYLQPGIHVTLTKNKIMAKELRKEYLGTN